jgi:hypothetical protein
MKNCVACGKPIDPERAEALPHTKVCINCAKSRPEPVRHDANDLARASGTGRNGFAPKD